MMPSTTAEAGDRGARLAHPDGSRPSCVFVSNYYPAFLRTVYENNPGLSDLPFAEQRDQILATAFGDSDFYSSGLRALGWATEEIIANAPSLQAKWAQEQALRLEGTALLQRQIQMLSPDVVYFQDLSLATREFLDAVRPCVRLIVGQIASPPPAVTHWAGLDLLISSFPHFVDRFRAAGGVAYYQPLAFEPRIARAVADTPRVHPLTFVGGISAAHAAGNSFLAQIAAELPLEVWGYGAGNLQPGSPLALAHRGEAWGWTMFRRLAASRITLNRHIDVAENHANNMRLFEATGCGALLVTDHKDNLCELFEPGREVVSYRSPGECIELVRHYLAHPEEAEAIAAAGQRRTLEQHTYGRRMKATAEWLSLNLERRKRRHLRIPENIAPSEDYQELASRSELDLAEGWKSTQVARRQRDLVDSQLEATLRGRPPPEFVTLAHLLRDEIRPGDALVEIGCASGYYFEALEYLLKRDLDYTGIDFSEAFIDDARSHYPRAKFFVGDAQALDLPDRSFPIAVSAGVLLTLPDPEQHLRELRRITSRLAVLHRTPVRRQGPTVRYRKKSYGMPTLELHFGADDLAGMLARTGFRVRAGLRVYPDSGEPVVHLTHLLEPV